MGGRGGGKKKEKKKRCRTSLAGSGRRRERGAIVAPLINNANMSTLSRRQIARSAGVPWAYVYASCCPRSDEEKKKNANCDKSRSPSDRLR